MSPRNSKKKTGKVTTPTLKKKGKKMNATNKPKRQRAKKDGLRSGQIRVLQLLSKVKSPLSEAMIAERAPAAPSWLRYFLFASNITEVPKKAGKVISELTPKGKEIEKNGRFPSLLGLGYIKGKILDIDGKLERNWTITSAGEKFLKSLEVPAK